MCGAVAASADAINATGGIILDMQLEPLRYILHRTIDSMFGRGGMLVVMLNPSTATDEVDDPTIRRCIGFAKREGCASLMVGNLSPVRATNPKDLIAAGPEEPDVVWRNISAINDMSQGARLVVAAWGNHGRAEERDLRMIEALPWVTWHCLGTTKEGYPRHPLYVSANQPLEVYSAKTATHA